jgi:hypothetical protein
VSAIQRLAQSCLQRPADRRHGAPDGEDGGSGAGAVCLTKRPSAAGMRHDAPPAVWKPRRTIAFPTETAFQGLPLQLLMPRRSSSAAMARSD